MSNKIYRGLLLAFSLPVTIGIISNLLTIHSWQLSIMMIAFLCGYYLWLRPYFWRISSHLTNQQVRMVIYATFAFILVVQIGILIVLPATVYHDPFRVLYQAQLISHGDRSWSEITYFWRYSNNVAITWFLSRWLIVTNACHLSVYWSVHLLNLILLDGFLALIVYAVHQCSQQQLPILTVLMLISCSAVSYTYFLQVFYTDLPLLLAVLLDWLTFLFWRRLSTAQRWWASGGLVVLNLSAQMIKSNLIIIGIALLLTCCFNPTASKKYRQPIIAILIGLCLATPTNWVLNADINFQDNARYQFPLLHWFNMGYNSQTAGRYSHRDARILRRLPSKQARQQYLQHHFPQRLRRLGGLGIIRLWFQKIAILFDVQSLPRAYTGGFQQIPRSYSRWQRGFHLWGQWSNQLALLLILSLALQQIWTTAWNRHYQHTWLEIFTIIAAGGFLLFHTLVWETENRYGQVIILLLSGYLLLHLPQPPKPATTVGTPAMLVTIGVLLLCLTPQILTRATKPATMVVTAQRSQLSHQYHFKTPEFPGQTRFSQTLLINHAVNKLWVLAPKRANAEVDLLDSGGHIRRLVLQKKTWVYRGFLPAGQYKLVIKAHHPHQRMRIVVTDGLNYRLALQPLFINGQAKPYYSLIYAAHYSQ